VYQWLYAKNQSHTKAHPELSDLVENQTDRVKTNYTSENVKPIDCGQHVLVSLKTQEVLKLDGSWSKLSYY